MLLNKFSKRAPSKNKIKSQCHPRIFWNIFATNLIFPFIYLAYSISGSIQPFVVTRFTFRREASETKTSLRSDEPQSHHAISKARSEKPSDHRPTNSSSQKKSRLLILVGGEQGASSRPPVIIWWVKRVNAWAPFLRLCLIFITTSPASSTLHFRSKHVTLARGMMFLGK